VIRLYRAIGGAGQTATTTAKQEGKKFGTKKTPLGERGVRVIVVVANSVSVQRLGLWWIIVVVVTALLIVVYSYSY